MRVSLTPAQLLHSPLRAPGGGQRCGQVGSVPHRTGDAQPGSARGSSPARPCSPRGTAARGSAVPVRLPGATGGARLLPEADPLLLTGDWRSRCPASRSSALGSCAAGLMLGIDRGSRCPARIRAGSNTRTRKERAAFLQERGFPTASLFLCLSHRTATPCSPAGVTAGCPGTEQPRERGAQGRSAGHTGWLLRLPKGSPDPRQAEPLRLLPAQGVRGQRGSVLPGRTLSPGCLFKFGEVGPTPSKGAWGFGVNPCQAWRQTPLRRGSGGAAPSPGHSRQHPRAVPSPSAHPSQPQGSPKPRHHTAKIHVSPVN